MGAEPPRSATFSARCPNLRARYPTRSTTLPGIQEVPILANWGKHDAMPRLRVR